VEDWDVADPYGEDAAIYQRILKEIQGRVKNLAQRLREEQRAAGNAE
jgi:protein-tyrosine-phosphatase